MLKDEQDSQDFSLYPVWFAGSHTGVNFLILVYQAHPSPEHPREHLLFFFHKDVLEEFLKYLRMSVPIHAVLFFLVSHEFERAAFLKKDVYKLNPFRF